ncbi:MAG: Asp-tRNA(Asn)/Glu-tRNA(Gln) amidotransferase GatCAB subunit C [Acidobacteria bacterium]|nr:MAG: Asp-tRNA(Asn)/Glu-tRNA(Gln) amidotransferase GatCAB subunit C [Acidobacteriota bacterium]
MAITRDEVLKIAALAHLHFSEEEIRAFTGQFERILDYVAKLEEVDVTGVEPTSHVSAAEGAQLLRADEVRPSLPVSEALANAPDAGHGHFKVPKVL